MELEFFSAEMLIADSNMIFKTVEFSREKGFSIEKFEKFLVILKVLQDTLSKVIIEKSCGGRFLWKRN